MQIRFVQTLFMVCSLLVIMTILSLWSIVRPYKDMGHITYIPPSAHALVTPTPSSGVAGVSIDRTSPPAVTPTLK